MEICCGGGADVLGSTDAVGAGGTGCAEDVGDVGNGVVTVGAAGCNLGLLCILYRMANYYVLIYVLRWEVLSTGQKLPLVNSKNGLAISVAL